MQMLGEGNVCAQLDCKAPKMPGHIVYTILTEACSGVSMQCFVEDALASKANQSEDLDFFRSLYTQKL